MDIPFLQPVAKTDARSLGAGRSDASSRADRQEEGEDFTSAYEAGVGAPDDETVDVGQTGDAAPKEKSDSKAKLAAESVDDGAGKSAEPADAEETALPGEVRRAVATERDAEAVVTAKAATAGTGAAEKKPVAQQQNAMETAFRHRLAADETPATPKETKEPVLAPAASTAKQVAAGTAEAVSAQGDRTTVAEGRSAPSVAAKPAESEARAALLAGSEKITSGASLGTTSPDPVPAEARAAARLTGRATTAMSFATGTVSAEEQPGSKRDPEALRILHKTEAAAATPPPAAPAKQAGGAMVTAAEVKHPKAAESSLFDLHQASDAEQEISVFRDARPSTPGNLAQVLARAETPAMIARQMAEALQRLPDRPVELALSPKELGKVKLSISTSDTGITVSVLAERQETLDLMRRHIHELAKEFQGIGYGSVEFSFAEGQMGDGTQSDDDKPSGLAALNAVEEIPEAEAEAIRLVASEGLDIRL